MVHIRMADTRRPSVNQSKRKRMANKLGYTATRIAAIMCQERRNCVKKKRKK